MKKPSNEQKRRSDQNYGTDLDDQYYRIAGAGDTDYSLPKRIALMNKKIADKLCHSIDSASASSDKLTGELNTINKYMLFVAFIACLIALFQLILVILEFIKG